MTLSKVAAEKHGWSIAAVALAIVIGMQFPLIWQRSIHWDEFFHYSQLHQLANGTLTRPLQTLHTRMFGWVLDIPGNGIDHTIIIRFAMFGFELLAAASIAGIAARFTDRVTGLICAAAYVSGGFVFQHGFSFRADPMAAGLLMASLWLLLSSRMRWPAIFAVGLMLGTSAMITIKIILFAPAFAGVAWLRWKEEGKSVQWIYRLAGAGLVTVATFALLYFFHSSGLGVNSDAAARTVISTSAEKMFILGIPPYLIYALKQVLLAPVLAAVIVIFPGSLLRSSFSLDQRIALAGLFAPLLTLFFYHNTAPYYYAFMLPPVVAACSIVIADFRRKFGTWLVAGLFAVTALMLWSKESAEPIRNQRTLMAAAEKMFPQKVAYIDFCAFLGEFPKANNFMTPWGIELYKAGIVPDIRTLLATKVVPLVMDNDPMFTRLLTTDEPALEFKPEDAAAMRATYIHLWGPYWIAGGKFAGGSKVDAFEIRVPGPYTVKDSELVIDGKTYAAGDVVQLDRGTYQVSTIERGARLVWGDNIKVPDQPAPTESFWTPF